MAMSGATQPAVKIIALRVVAPVIRQSVAAMNGYSGPQSTSFPVGYAVIGSNQLYCGKSLTMTSICLRVYQESVSYIYKNPGSLMKNAGIILRTNATPIKMRMTATIR